MTIPGLAGGAIGTKYDWNLTYAPSTAVGNRSIPIPLGKVVGGSTKLNRMVFDRGSKCDYDRWEALGNEDWGFDDLLPYFKKVRVLNTFICMLTFRRMSSLRHHPMPSSLNGTSRMILLHMEKMAI